MTEARIFCCIAGCKRSWKDDGKGGEIICGRHYRMASLSLRNRFKRIRAAIRVESRRFGVQTHDLDRLDRLYALQTRCWKRIVAAADGTGRVSDQTGIARELEALGL